MAGKDGRKTSTAEVNRRVAQVFGYMVEGKATHSIHKLVKDEYGVCTKTVENYIQRANKDLRRMMETKKNDALNRGIMLRETLIERMIGNDQLAVASQVLDSKNKLEGLFETEAKTNVNITLIQE